MSSSFKNITPCPCGTEKSYAQCCQPYHLATLTPNTAEKLMRSRYSAYVLQLTNYLFDTWHATTRPDLATLAPQPIKWMQLTINNTYSSEQPNEAFVDFTARYKVNGKAEKMNEISRFVFENDRWLYIDGKVS